MRRCGWEIPGTCGCRLRCELLHFTGCGCCEFNWRKRIGHNGIRANEARSILRVKEGAWLYHEAERAGVARLMLPVFASELTSRLQMLSDEGGKGAVDDVLGGGGRRLSHAEGAGVGGATAHCAAIDMRARAQPRRCSGTVVSRLK